MFKPYTSYAEIDADTVAYLLLVSGANDIQEVPLEDINSYLEGLYAIERDTDNSQAA